MIKRVSCAAVLLAAVSIAVPAWAEGPMTPVRRTAPAAEPSNPAHQWIEPPAASRPAPPRSAAENAVPGAEAEVTVHLPRDSRQGHHTVRLRRWAARRPAYGGWAALSMPYYRGYGPAPYSNSGD